MFVLWKISFIRYCKQCYKAALCIVLHLQACKIEPVENSVKSVHVNLSLVTLVKQKPKSTEVPTFSPTLEALNYMDLLALPLLSFPCSTKLPLHWQ